MFFTLIIAVIIIVKAVIEITSLKKEREKKNLGFIKPRESLSVGAALSIVGSIIMILSFFLNWFSSLSGLNLAIDGYHIVGGSLSIVFIIPIAAVLILLFSSAESKSKVLKYGYITLAVLLIFEGYWFIILVDAYELPFFVFQANMGYWLVIVGIVIVLIGGRTIEEIETSTDDFTDDFESVPTSDQEDEEENYPFNKQESPSLPYIPEDYHLEEDNQVQEEEQKENEKEEEDENRDEDSELEISTIAEAKIEIEDLKEEEPMIDIREIEKAISEEDFVKINEELSSLKKDFSEYQETLDMIRSLDKRKTTLAEKLADGEIDRETYRDASESIEYRKAKIEEKLSDLRNKVIHEDYAKPF